jgi:ABC-type uncharacterized transport system permease subunit
MKNKIVKIVAAVLLLVLCAAAVELTVGISSASFSVTGAVPLVSAAMMLIMWRNFSSYPKKSAGMNAGGERLNEAERTLMYHSLASVLVYFVIPDIFLIAYFPSAVRMAGGVLLFVAGVYVATAYARRVTDRAFKERIAREGDESAEINGESPATDLAAESDGSTTEASEGSAADESAGADEGSK